MDTRSALVASARSITLSDGIDALTMRRVAKESGFGTMTAYRHFHNKESLLSEIAFEGFELFCEYFYRSLAGGSPAHRLWLCGEQYLEFSTENPRYYEAMFTVTGAVGRSEAQMAAALQFLTDRVAEAANTNTRPQSTDVPLGSPTGHTAPRPDQQKPAATSTAWSRATALSLFSHCHGMVTLHLARRYDPALDFAGFFRQSLLSSLVGANLVPTDFRPMEGIEQ